MLIKDCKSTETTDHDIRWGGIIIVLYIEINWFSKTYSDYFAFMPCKATNSWAEIWIIP